MEAVSSHLVMSEASAAFLASITLLSSSFISPAEKVERGQKYLERDRDYSVFSVCVAELPALRTKGICM